MDIKKFNENNLSKSFLSFEETLNLLSRTINPQPVLPTKKKKVFHSNDTFAESCRESFMTLYPVQYQNLIKEKDFSPDFFTCSLTTDVQEEVTYYYAKKMRFNEIQRRNLLINKAIWNKLSIRQQDKLKNKAKKSYKIQTLLQPLKEASYSLPINEDEEDKLAEKKQIIEAVKENLTPLEKVPLLEDDPLHTVTVAEIKRSLNPKDEHASNEVLELSETAKVQKKMSIYEYTLKNDPKRDTTLMSQIIINNLITRVTRDYELLEARITDTRKWAPYYHIYVYYLHRTEDNHVKFVKMRIGEGFSYDSMPQILNLNTDIEDQISGGYNPYDFQANQQGYYLDFNRFAIHRVTLLTSGGAILNFEDLCEALDAVPKNHTGRKSFHLPWCKVINYQSSKNNCFYKILYEVIKSKSELFDDKYSSFSSYLSFKNTLRAEVFSPTGKEERVSIELAEILCKHLKIKLEVYSYDSSLIFESDVIVPDNRILRVMLVKEHYLLITDYEKVEQINSDVEENIKLVKESITVPVYYDCETIYDNKLGSNNAVIPYAISFKIEELQFHMTATPSLDIIFGKLLDHIIDHFNKNYTEFEEMMKVENKIKKKVVYKLIAYNGYNFDHILLHTYMVKKGYISLVPPESNGKIKKVIFSLNFDPNLICPFIEIWDPCAFTMRTLNSTAECFGLKIRKEEISHTEIQEAYESGNFKNFICSNYQKLKEYTNRDVQLLIDVTEKLVDTFNNSFNIDVMSKPTLAKAAYDIFQDETVFRGNKIPSPLESYIGVKPKKKDNIHIIKMKHICIPVKTRDQDRFIRCASRGGRVHATPGVYKDMHMIDVTSLYPHCMMKYGYPVGNPVYCKGEFESYRNSIDVKIIELNHRKKLSELKSKYGDDNDKINELMKNFEIKYDEKNIDECLKYFEDKENYIGIYECLFDQTNIKAKNILVPLKLDGQEVDWEFKGEQVIPLPDNIIRTLLDYDCECKLTGTAIIWNKSKPGYLFNKLLSLWGEIKNHQDRIKGTEEYNPVLREMAKLIMNSLSGKMIQRNFDSELKFWNDNSKLINFLTARIEEKIPVLPFTEKACYTESITDGFSKRSKPSQIACFIYSYSHELMFRNCLANHIVYLTDTDSALISKESFEQMKKENLISFGVKEFGKFVDEAEDGSKVIDLAIVTGKKCYCFINNDQVFKWRCKGVRKTDNFIDKNGICKPIDENCIEFFSDLLIRDVQISTWHFQKSAKKGIMKYEKLSKIIKC